MDKMPEPKFPEVVSSSLRSSFNACHRKFYWEQIVGVVPKGENIHFVFGGAYAHALEYFRRNYNDPALVGHPDRYNIAVAAGLEALILSYGHYEPDDRETKTFDRCVGAYIEYLYRYDPDKDHVQTSRGPGGRPRVEFSFTYTVDEVRHPVTGNPLIFSGRFDQLADYNGSLFVFDDKTTGQLGPKWADQWDLRSQFTSYCFGAQTADLPVVGAIVRGMGILKTKFSTSEAIVARPQWMVDRWRDRLIWDLKRMVEAWESNYWPHTGEESGACSHYGRCPYTDLCLSRFPEAYLGQLQPYRYSPLAKEGERAASLPGRFLRYDPAAGSSDSTS